MKINENISITGVYVYSASQEYEENDFVIHNGQLYVCHPKEGKTVQGGVEGPDLENFVAYLGDSSATEKDLKAFLEGGGDNKLVTVPMMHVFRNLFMMGLNDRGIIGEMDKGKTVDTIFEEENLNNAMFKISRSNLGVNPLLYTPYPEYTDDLEMKTKVSQDYYDTDLDHVILRQFTYLKGDRKVRVQELIDPWNGLIYLRSGFVPGSIKNTPWRCTSENVLALKKKAEVIFDLYSSRLKVLDEMKARLENNFRFRRCNITPGPVVSISGVPTEPLEMNITITKGDGPKQLFGAEIDGEGEYIVGGETLIVKISGDTVSLNVSGGCTITGAYYREYYDF